MKIAIPFGISLFCLMQACGVGAFLYQAILDKTKPDSFGRVKDDNAGWSVVGYGLLALAGWITGLAMHASHPYLSNTAFGVISIAAPDVIVMVLLGCVYLLIPGARKAAKLISGAGRKRGNS